MRCRLAEFLKDDDGATAVEYAVMLALIIVGCAMAASWLGTVCRWRFGDVAIALGN